MLFLFFFGKSKLLIFLSCLFFLVCWYSGPTLCALCRDLIFTVIYYCSTSHILCVVVVFSVVLLTLPPLILSMHAREVYSSWFVLSVYSRSRRSLHYNSQNMHQHEEDDDVSRPFNVPLFLMAVLFSGRKKRRKRCYSSTPSDHTH